MVRYLMETMCMFVMGRELYIYRDGCYYLDQDGIKVKAVVSKLIPEKFITFRCLSAVYNLLIEQQELQKSLEELNAYPPWWINFKNGMFDVREGNFVSISQNTCRSTRFLMPWIWRYGRIWMRREKIRAGS